MSENFTMDEKLKSFLTEYSDIIHYPIDDIKLKCFTKLKTNLDGVELLLSYDDILTIKKSYDDLLSSNVGGFLCYDIDDDTYLLAIDNILEVVMDNKDYKKLEDLYHSNTILQSNIKLSIEHSVVLGFEFTDNVRDLLLKYINEKKEHLDYFKSKGII